MRVIGWLLASTTSAFLLRGGPCITNTAMSVFRGGIADGDPARLERDALTRRFLAAFGDDTNPVVVAFAPGRANLIGEHTDYQDGLVMPFALDVGVYARLRDHRQPVLTRDVHGGDATEPERCLERRVRLRATPRKPAQNPRSQHLHRRRQRGLRQVLGGSTNSGHVSQSIVRVCSG